MTAHWTVIAGLTGAAPARRAVNVEYVTLGWNGIEAAVAIGSGVMAGSVALTAFGIDSHYRRADDEAHSLLRETFRASGDIEVLGDTLHVRLDGLSAPRRSRAIAAVCEELNATETLYPGTNLRLVYSVKGY